MLKKCLTGPTLLEMSGYRVLSGIDRLTAKRRRHAFAGQREQPQLKRFLPSACYFFKRGNAQKKEDNNKSGRDVCAGRLESLCEVGVQHDRERASLS